MYRLPWLFEHAVAAVHRNLSDLADDANGLLTFERESITSSSVIYDLSYPERYPAANDLGRFELCERPDGDTEIIITRPRKPPFRPFNDEENRVLDAAPREDYARLTGLTAHSIEEERGRVRRRRIEQQEHFIHQMFVRLKIDPMLLKPEPPSVEVSEDTPREPTYKTKMRAAEFKHLKDAHPGWTYYRVAMEAAFRLQADNLTAETVRNAYRAMKRAYPDQAEEWTWERSDRVR